MPIARSRQPIAASRISAIAEQLLDASELCAIATVARRGQAYVNTAYFAWTPALRVVWLSDPEATHSRNLAANSSAAISVYDSSQSWNEADRGIQLFGSAGALAGAAVREADAVYARRFPAYDEAELSAYRLYEFRPRRVKLFDEQALGGGTFVTAHVAADGRVTWERTEVYDVTS
jgi:uncharacterized protein YhbP (UPF0306 family)